nr:RHS repeat-associated core domain-containing protein [Mesonia sp. K7]
MWDKETGNYYGARYYNPKWSIWLSVDPLAEEMPAWSSYAYTFQNPIRYTDPTGMIGEDWIKDRYGNYLWDDEAVDQSTTRKGWQYVGKELPEGVRDNQILTEKDGKLYYKNTTNTPAQLFNYVNSFFGGDDDYFTEHKPYDPATDYALSEGINTGVGFVGGNYVFKGLSAGLSRLGSGLTSSDGFLIGGITVKAPFNIPVQRFGNMSLGRSDFWGLRIGTNPFINRTFAAIKPSWNPLLTQYTTGFIPKGTPMKFGIIGPQGIRYPGGSLQFIIGSKGVIKQSSKYISR